MIKTTLGAPLPDEVVENYLSVLVNRFFKILPIRESQNDTLPIYIRSLQAEMLGCKVLVEMLGSDSDFLSLLSVLQYLHDNENCPVADVKREVFKAISLIGKLKKRYEVKV